MDEQELVKKMEEHLESIREHERRITPEQRERSKQIALKVWKHVWGGYSDTAESKKDSV